MDIIKQFHVNNKFFNKIKAVRFYKSQYFLVWFCVI